MPSVPPPLETLRFARVVLTGRFAAGRSQVETRVEDARGTVLSTVSRRTTAVAVGSLGWPLLPDGRMSAALRRAEELNRRGARIRVLSEHALLRLAGNDPLEPRRGAYRFDEAAAALGVDADQLRHWTRLGLVESTDETLDFQDLVSLRTLTSLVQSGARPETISASLRDLATHLPDTARPLAQLTLLVESPRSLVAEIEGVLVDRRGQFLLDFETGETRVEESAAPLSLPADANVIEALLHRAATAERDARLADAADWYRQALALEPDPIAWFNLGNVLREAGDEPGAEDAFQRATSMDESFAQAWYNLADLVDLEDPERAIRCLRRAVDSDPTYADAHFNLAAALDELARTTEAAAHWRRYVQLDPSSEWADLARGKLGQS